MNNELLAQTEKLCLLTLPMLIKQAREIQKKLSEKLKYKSKYEINFVMSHNSLVCCFDGKRCFVTDENLNPIFAYESTSYIHACSISDTGKYIAFQMAYNKANDTNSGAMAIVDVSTKKIVCKKPLQTGWKSITHLFIDEKEPSIWVYYGDKKVRYNFDLELK